MCQERYDGYPVVSEETGAPDVGHHYPSPTSELASVLPSGEYYYTELLEDVDQADVRVQPEFQQEILYSFNPSLQNQANWPSAESQPMQLAQFNWDSSYNLHGRNMGTYAPIMSDYFPRQMPSSDYDDAPFDIQLHIDPAMESGFTSKSPVIHPESPETKSDVASGFQSEDGEERHEPPAVEDRSEGGRITKPNIPYAQYIWMALMSVITHSMTLPQIYQWFRDNTDKASSESKGWQNSIRHNLSMNAAFTKRDAKSGETKKSSEWVLEPWAVRDGVQSTTRYRKGNPTRRGGSSAHRSHGNTSARASSGRRGGVNTNKGKSIRTRRAMATRATNLGLLSGQIDQAQGPTVQNPPSYNYLPNTLAANPSNQTNWMVRPIPSVAALPAQYNYNGPILQQAIGNFFPSEQAPNLFTNPQEPVDDRSNNFTWDPTPAGGAYI